jgi:phenylacetate-CoA ligase
MIAAECEAHNGLHVTSPAAYLEYVPLEECEEPGVHEVLVTDLLNYGMPVIRYRVNDCVVIGDDRCKCGRGYPLIKKIIGRTGDIFLLPDGSKVPGVALTNRVLQVCPELKKVQVVQEEIDRFQIRYVAGEGFEGRGYSVLKENLKKFFPQQVRWEFVEVADIEREKSGKTRFCISKVDLRSYDVRENGAGTSSALP